MAELVQCRKQTERSICSEIIGSSVVVCPVPCIVLQERPRDKKDLDSPLNSFSFFWAPFSSGMGRHLSNLSFEGF